MSIMLIVKSCIFNRQTYSVRLEKQSLNFAKLQRKLNNIVKKKMEQDVELNKAYFEAEDSIDELYKCAQQ